MKKRVGTTLLAAMLAMSVLSFSGCAQKTAEPAAEETPEVAADSTEAT